MESYYNNVDDLAKASVEDLAKSLKASSKIVAKGLQVQSSFYKNKKFEFNAALFLLYFFFQAFAVRLSIRLFSRQ